LRIIRELGKTYLKISIKINLNKVLQVYCSLCFATDEDDCAVENFYNTLFKCIYNLHEEIFCLIVELK
jgi:hypothetical protein